MQTAFAQALRTFADGDSSVAHTERRTQALKEAVKSALGKAGPMAMIEEARKDDLPGFLSLLFRVRYKGSGSDAKGGAEGGVFSEGNDLNALLYDKDQKARANESLDTIFAWLKQHPLEKKLVLTYLEVAEQETQHHKVREQGYVFLFEWLKVQKQKMGGLTDSERKSVVDAFLRVVRSGLTDVWSAIRKACATRVGVMFELLDKHDLEAFCGMLMELCNDPSASRWRQKEGALLVFASILKKFQWAKEGSAGEGKQVQLKLKFSTGLYFDSLPAYLSSSLRVHLFSMLEDDQLCVRENAKKAFVFLMTRSNHWEVYQSFVDVIEVLEPAEVSGARRTWDVSRVMESGRMLGPSPALLKHRKWWRKQTKWSGASATAAMTSGGGGSSSTSAVTKSPTRSESSASNSERNDMLEKKRSFFGRLTREDSERSLSPSPPPPVSAFGAEGLLSLAVTLIKSLPAPFLLANWTQFIDAFNMYLMHEASTVRQMTSAIFKALVMPSVNGQPEETALCLRVLSFLCLDWDLVDVEGTDPQKWEWREGRLLALEIVLGFLVSNYYNHRGVASNGYFGGGSTGDRGSSGNTPVASHSPKPLHLSFSGISLFGQSHPDMMHTEKSGGESSATAVYPHSEAKSRHDFPTTAVASPSPAAQAGGDSSRSVASNASNVPISPLSPMFPTQYLSPTPSFQDLNVSTKNDMAQSTSILQATTGIATGLSVLDRLRQLEAMSGGSSSEDESPRKTDSEGIFEQPQRLSPLLSFLLDKTSMCHGDQRWEVRRMSSQVLPFLVHVIMLYKWRIMRRFWLSSLREEHLSDDLIETHEEGEEEKEREGQGNTVPSPSARGGKAVQGCTDLLTPSPTWPGGVQNTAYVACRSLNFVLSKIDRRFRFSSYGSPNQKLSAPLFADDGSIDEEGPIGPSPHELLALLEAVLPSISLLCRSSRFMRLGVLCAEILLRVIVKNERHIHHEGHSILSSQLLALRQSLSLSVFSRFARLRTAMTFGEGWGHTAGAGSHHKSASTAGSGAPAEASKGGEANNSKPPSLYSPPPLKRGGSAPSSSWPATPEDSLSSPTAYVNSPSGDVFPTTNSPSNVSPIPTLAIIGHSHSQIVTGFHDDLVRAQIELQLRELRRFGERRKLILHWSAQVHRDLVLRIAPLFEHGLFSMNWKEAVGAAAVQLKSFLPVMKEEEMHPQTLLLDSVEALLCTPIVQFLTNMASEKKKRSKAPVFSSGKKHSLKPGGKSDVVESSEEENSNSKNSGSARGEGKLAGRSLLKDFMPSSSKDGLVVQIPDLDATSDSKAQKTDEGEAKHSSRSADEDVDEDLVFPSSCKASSLLFRSFSVTCNPTDIDQLVDLFLPPLIDLAVSEGLENVVRRRALHLLSVVVCIHGDLRVGDRILSPLLRHVFESCPELKDGRARTPRVPDSQLIMLLSDDARCAAHKEDGAESESLADLALEEEEFREDVERETGSHPSEEDDGDEDWDDWDDEDDEDEEGVVVAGDIGRFCNSLRDIPQLRRSVFQRCAALYIFDRPRKVLDAEGILERSDSNITGKFVAKVLDGVKEEELRKRMNVRAWRGDPYDHLVKVLGDVERQAFVYACSKGLGR